MNTNLRGKRTSTLPAGWQKLTDELSGRQYYYNQSTKESVWQSPRTPIDYNEQEHKVCWTEVAIE